MPNFSAVQNDRGCDKDLRLNRRVQCRDAHTNGATPPAPPHVTAPLHAVPQGRAFAPMGARRAQAQLDNMHAFVQHMICTVQQT